MIKKAAGIVTIVVVIFVIAIGIAKAHPHKVQLKDGVSENQEVFKRDSSVLPVDAAEKAKMNEVVVDYDFGVYAVVKKGQLVNRVYVMHPEPVDGVKFLVTYQKRDEVEMDSEPTVKDVPSDVVVMKHVHVFGKKTVGLVEHYDHPRVGFGVVV